MASHPKRAITPARRRFLEAAIANQGHLYRTGISLDGKYHWASGNVTLREGSGEQLRRLGWIKRVLAPNRLDTQKVGSDFLYRVTAAGYAAIGAEPPVGEADHA